MPLTITNHFPLRMQKYVHDNYAIGELYVYSIVKCSYQSQNIQLRVLESGQTLELESRDYFLKISVLEETNDFKIAFQNKRDNRPAIYDRENFIFSGRKYMANVKTVFIDWFTDVSDTLE